MDSVRYNRVEMVQLLIKSKADLNARDNIGRTALMLAVVGTRTDSVKTLIDSGADVNIKDAQGDTALKYAKKMGEKEIIALLKKARAK